MLMKNIHNLLLATKTSYSIIEFIIYHYDLEWYRD